MGETFGSYNSIRLKGKANEALFELSKKFNLEPTELVERLLIQHADAIRDEALCKKKMFKSSIVYQLELPFCFPYECEEFNVQFQNINARLYLERVPKRQVINTLPFRTLATLIIELTSEQEKFAKENEPHIAGDKLHSKYSTLAYNILKSLIIIFRRVTKDYYNIGVIKPPINLEEFQKKTKMSIILNQQYYARDVRFMPIKEGSFVSVAQPLDKRLHSEIIASVTGKLSNKELDFLTQPNEYLDAAIVFYYQEQWNLCLLDSVIAMESGMANLVLHSAATKSYLKRTSGGLSKLKKVYREASGLPKKIQRFLFPIIDEFNISEVQSNLRGMMPLICNKKREDGIYDLRSKIIHEGISINKQKAEDGLKIASQFLEILKSVNMHV